MNEFDITKYSDPKAFEIAGSAQQYKEITSHVEDVVKIHNDFLVTEFCHDLSKLMTLENNAGWDDREKHDKKVQLLFDLQNKYQPVTDRFLS